MGLAQGPEQKYWGNKLWAECWQLLLCFRPLQSTSHRATAGPATTNRQDLGLANSFLPPLTQSLPQGQFDQLLHSPSPQQGLPWAKPCQLLWGPAGCCWVRVGVGLQ